MSDGAYLGICSHGKARAIYIDKPEYRKALAREIADWVRSGLTIQYVSVDEGRKRIQESCLPCDENRDKGLVQRELRLR